MKLICIHGVFSKETKEIGDTVFVSNKIFIIGYINSSGATCILPSLHIDVPAIKLYFKLMYLYLTAYIYESQQAEYLQVAC